MTDLHRSAAAYRLGADMLDAAAAAAASNMRAKAVELEATAKKSDPVDEHAVDAVRSVLRAIVSVPVEREGDGKTFDDLMEALGFADLHGYVADKRREWQENPARALSRMDAVTLGKVVAWCLRHYPT